MFVLDGSTIAVFGPFNVRYEVSRIVAEGLCIKPFERIDSAMAHKIARGEQAMGVVASEFARLNRQRILVQESKLRAARSGRK